MLRAGRGCAVDQLVDRAGHIAGIVFRIAIEEIRVVVDGAGSPAVRVALGQDDLDLAQLGKFADHSEAGVHIGEQRKQGRRLLGRIRI